MRKLIANCDWNSVLTPGRINVFHIIGALITWANGTWSVHLFFVVFKIRFGWLEIQEKGKC